MGAPGRPEALCSPGGPRGLTYVAVVHPDAVAVVAGPAFHDVIGVVRLRHLVVGVDDDLGESLVGGGPALATLRPRPS